MLLKSTPRENQKADNQANFKHYCSYLLGYYESFL